MPANLTPEYHEAERAYRAARSTEEKLACARRMLSVIPKHKGTDRMQGDLKRRIARLKESIERQRKRRGPSYRVKPEGAGQIMLVGPPNAGKSSLLARLTRAEPEVADYPCTTREPLPGMVPYLDTHFQLVDLPPVWREHCESFVYDNVRAADGAALVVDVAGEDPVRDISETMDLLAARHIRLVAPGAPRTGSGPPWADIEAVVVLNQCDRDPDGDLTALVRGMLTIDLPVCTFSAGTGAGAAPLVETLYGMLHVIRIYTKEQGEEPDLDTPYTAPAGCTVKDFAAFVHKDFAVHLKQARVWGSARFDGQAVPRDHVLQDGDIVELEI
ncbi:MAG: 50S ribosome-binding GTPase [Lentisphaerae bacterium]|nr:50S ribosome-binding GTPase [Lentisphaerota bacterium]